jgi:O-antigen ligase
MHAKNSEFNGQTPSLFLSIVLGSVIFLNFASYLFENPVFKDFLGILPITFYKVVRIPLLLAGLLIIFNKYLFLFKQAIRENQDVIVFLILTLVSSCFSKDPLNSFLYSFWLCLSILFILSFFKIDFYSGLYFDSLKRIGFILIFCNIIFNIFIFMDLPVSYQLGSLFSEYENIRNNYIYSTLQLVQGLILFLYFYQRKSFSSFILFLIILLFVLSLTAIVFSAKRSVILSAFASSGLLAISYFKFRLSNFIAAFLIVVSAYFIFINTIELASRTNSRFERAFVLKEDASINARVSIYENYLSVFEEYPYFGTGLLGGRLLSKENESAFADYSYHNTYLGYLVETGGFGFIFFVLILTRSLSQAFTHFPRRDLIIYIGFILPPLFISISENNMTPGQAYFWPLWIAILFPRAMIQGKTNNF